MIIFSLKAKKVGIALATASIFNEERGNKNSKLLIDIFDQVLN